MLRRSAPPQDAGFALLGRVRGEEASAFLCHPERSEGSRARQRVAADAGPRRSGQGHLGKWTLTRAERRGRVSVTPPCQGEAIQGRLTPQTPLGMTREKTQEIRN